MHYQDESKQTIWVEQDRLWEAVFLLDYDQPNVFDLSNADEGLDRYIPARSVAMIDMPLYQVVDAARQENQDIEVEMRATRGMENDGS